MMEDDNHQEQEQQEQQHQRPFRKPNKITKCSHQVTDQTRQKFRDHLNRIQSKGVNANVDAGVYLVTRIKYVVIPLSAAGNISDAQIQAQHNVINLHFAAYQNSSLLTASSVHYPYRNSMGDPKILFNPVDSSQLTEAAGLIVRMNIPSTLPSGDGYTDVTQVEAEYKAQGGTVEAGFIYVYITTLGSTGDQTILGVAKDIIANACTIHYGTVGSEALPGPLTSYGEGKTLVHELGHCFGLFHPFSDSTCGSDLTAFIHSQTPQSPPQINPNIYTDLALLPTTDNGLDNRGRDYQRFCTGSTNCTADTTTGLKPGDTIAVPAYSCATTTELATNTVAYEAFFSFMDYGSDVNMIGFLSYNTATMRTVLTNYPDLFDVSEQVSPSTTPSFSPTPATSSSSSLPGWAIALIVIGGVLLVIIIFVVAFKLAPSPNKKTVSNSNDTIKPIQAYVQPFVKKMYV
jgi:hypothetical protein